MTGLQRDAFREEASELLAELETVLLELERAPEDADLIQRTFRALHTIKGSGAMFGFDEVSRFTHQLETAFDLVREGKLAATPELVNLTLAARDEIKAMLDPSLEGGGTANAGQAAQILSRLHLLVGDTGGSPAPKRSEPELKPDRGGQLRQWRIRFRPVPGILLKGANPLLLLRELRGLGEMQVTAHTDALPGLEQMDPESCYLYWDCVLRSACDEDAIRDVFIFVEGDCELSIEALSSGETLSGPVAQAPAPDACPENAVNVSAVRRAHAAVAASASVRVPAEKLDSLVNFVGQLVIVQARLTQLAASHDDPEILLIAEEIERLTAGLRDNAMSIRMLPLRATFDRFRRLVHDLTRDLGKEVELVTEGSDTELDKNVIDQLSDPLLHLIRNSMDHGIEPPEVRVTKGKPRTGTIRLSAIHSGACVLIRVSDDGGGLDARAVRERAIEKGLIAAEAELSESDVFSLILMPGFSTARTVTDLSGRGVGMDVVRRSVESLRGSIEIASRPGEGTTITLRLPLTLAIIDGLLARVSTAHFVVPLSSVVECVELSREAVRQAHGRKAADVRGTLIPYIGLRESFGIPGETPDIEQIVIVETSEGRYGFVVDEVLGDHQTVIKNLGRFYSHIQLISGATILGDGTVALILDPERLVENALRESSRQIHRPRKGAVEPQPAAV